MIVPWARLTWSGLFDCDGFYGQQRRIVVNGWNRRQAIDVANFNYQKLLLSAAVSFAIVSMQTMLTECALAQTLSPYITADFYCPPSLTLKLFQPEYPNGSSAWKTDHQVVVLILSQSEQDPNLVRLNRRLGRRLGLAVVAGQESSDHQSNLMPCSKKGSVRQKDMNSDFRFWSLIVTPILEPMEVASNRDPQTDHLASL